MMKYKKVIIPLYGGSKNSSINIVIADKVHWNKAMTFINSHNEEAEEFFEYNNVAAFACMTGKDGVNHFWMAFTKDKISMNTLSHEIVHLVNAIFISRGLKADLHNDEAQAYLTGWVMEESYKFLKPYIK